MPTSLTATKIKDTYGQLLHVDGGVTSTLKTVYDGDGTATALKISTTAVEIPSFTLSGGTANGVIYLNGSKVATTGSALTFDGSNLGLGVTPSAWYSTYKTFQLSSNGSLSSNTDFFALTNNAYTDASANDIYLTTGYAGRYRHVASSGQHQWFTAPSGTAGNAISFTQAMTLDASGNLGIGSTAPTAVGSYRVVELNGASGSYISLKTAATETGRVYSDASSTVFEAQGARPIWFATNGNERMRIDSSGNVGIGTSSPISRLSVNGYLNSQDSSNNGAIYLGQYLNANGAYGGFEWNNTSGLLTLRTQGAYPVTFGTNATERMRIDSSGNLLVGTTTFNGTNNGVQVASVGLIYVGRPAASTALAFYNTSAGTNVGNIVINSTSTTYATSSDYRLKENIQPMQNALARNALLKPCTYSWKSDGSTGEGFIAHELQAVCPDAVTGEKDAVDKDGKPVYQGVDTSFLVGHLVACIQELKAELDATKAEVAALKGN